MESTTKIYSGLSGLFPMNVEVSEEPSTSTNMRESQSSGFEGAIDRIKRRRMQSMREQHTDKELTYATTSLRASVKSNAAKVVHDITVGSPTKATRFIKSLNYHHEKQMTKDEALSLLIENKLSKNVYNNIRANSIRHNSKLYPSYKYVLQAKKECYPSAADITISECSAEVKLQALLDHTVERILLMQNEVINNLSADDGRHLSLICKWGCGGTSSQSSFKQKFDDKTDGNKTDASIFFMSLVPLQIVSVDKSTKKELVIWKNPRPSSPRFCRPIKIEFMVETAEYTRLQIKNIKQQERNLAPMQTIVDGKEINVTYSLVLTMIDGKACNLLTDTSSSQKCSLCQCTSKQFNNIDEILKKEIQGDNLQFGISILHAWIRVFECLLHISYKLGDKKCQSRGDDKKSIETRKKNIQKGFRQQLGLLVDEPKQGYRNTNDGYTARRFFANSQTSALITGVDETLIQRFHVILQVITCGFEINIRKYEEYCIETARLFVHLYPWFNMPITIHKLLIHSTKIIESSVLSIGQMSEVAQESCNKYIKKYRQDLVQKSSRIKNMEDVFSRLLVSSDPIISSMQKLSREQLEILESDTIKLLEMPIYESNLNSSSVTSSETESEHSSDEEY